MLKIKQLTDTYEMQVFTDTGDYFGDIDEALISGNKVISWRIKATRSSFLSRILGTAKGVVIPHHLVKAVGDIMIVAKSAVPAYDEDSGEGHVEE